MPAAQPARDIGQSGGGDDPVGGELSDRDRDGAADHPAAEGGRRRGALRRHHGVARRTPGMAGVPRLGDGRTVGGGVGSLLPRVGRRLRGGAIFSAAAHLSKDGRHRRVQRPASPRLGGAEFRDRLVGPHAVAWPGTGHRRRTRRSGDRLRRPGRPPRRGSAGDAQRTKLRALRAGGDDDAKNVGRHPDIRPPSRPSPTWGGRLAEGERGGALGAAPEA